MVPDRLRPTPPRAPDLQLVRALRALRPPPAPPPGPTCRVPPLEYGANVRTLVDRIRADGAVPYVLAFPMVDPPAAHLAALGAVGDAAPVWAPTLPADAYFAEDPIHLTPTGNDRLAELVAAALAGASMPVRP
jgi:lysophospholipase L1-like esterase